MKGDFTRDTFEAARHFSRVLKQQGRVELDADFNEQAAILLHLIRTLAKDFFGQAGGPTFDTPGFKISFPQGEANFTIGEGRYYVDGILSENEKSLTYRDQEGFAKERLPETNERYYVYLDVWERHITYVQDGRIREVALNGPDTCTRAQVVSQVKLSPALKDEGSDRDSACEWIDKNLIKRNVALKARVRPEGAYEDPCSLPPESRYRGLENHLYRIEVHRGGRAWDGGMDENDGKLGGNASEAATFKFSRDNGARIFAIVQQNGSDMILQSLGRDQRLSLDEQEWVEIIGDENELLGEPGFLARVLSVKPEEMTVTLDLPNDYKHEKLSHPLLRRWDQVAIEGRPMWQGAILITESDGESGWIEIEDGIEIQFQPAEDKSNATYRSGDYWLVPARVATGGIEWPIAYGNEEPQAIPPRGIEHHYAPIAVIEKNLQWTNFEP